MSIHDSLDFRDGGHTPGLSMGVCHANYTLYTTTLHLKNNLNFKICIKLQPRGF